MTSSITRHLTFLAPGAGPRPAKKFTVVGASVSAGPFTMRGRSKHDAEDFAAEIISLGGTATIIPELAR